MSAPGNSAPDPSGLPSSPGPGSPVKQPEPADETIQVGPKLRILNRAEDYYTVGQIRNGLEIPNAEYVRSMAMTLRALWGDPHATEY